MTRASAAALAVLSLGAIGAAAPAAMPAAPPAFASCRLEHPSRVLAVAAECTTLRVPEDRSRPGQARSLELFVARVPALSRRKAADPLFVLAGGPGLAASTFYASVAPAFAQIRRDRDIVLVDQRGTGRSNALGCALDPGLVLHASLEVLVAETGHCLQALRTRATVPLYTTSIAVRDLEAVRAALGYERVNLYGASYGTRVAQHYLRRYPHRVRALILDGVVPPELVLGPEIALVAQAALESILGRCAAQPACREAFGNPLESYHSLHAALARRSVRVRLPHPTSGEPWSVDFGPEQLATVLRLQSYTAEQAALLPLSLHLAAQQGNFAPLAGQFILATQSLEALAYGMHQTVVCSEDVPYFARASVDRAALRATYLGARQLEALEAMCRGWPTGPVDDDLHAPLRSEVPALLLSGSADPATPPSYAARALRGLAAGRHLVLEGQGHGQLTAPCMDRVMAGFLASTAPAALDASCLEGLRPLPFFTSLAGPAP